jgi:hypothetical protein
MEARMLEALQQFGKEVSKEFARAWDQLADG